MAIENKQGLIIVQDPDAAWFALMPGPIIANDHPDYVYTSKEIATKLLEKIALVSSQFIFWDWGMRCFNHIAKASHSFANVFTA